MQKLASTLAINQKTQSVTYRVTPVSPFITERLTINKLRAVESKEKLKPSEALADNHPLQFVALVGCTATAYLLKDSNDKLYLIPFKELSREDAHRYFSEPFQLATDEKGENPQFLSQTSLQALTLTTTQPGLPSTNYLGFNQWEPAREYIIDNSSLAVQAQSSTIERIVLKCVAVVAEVIVFEVTQIQYFPLNEVADVQLHLINKGDVVTNLQLSELLHEDATITPNVSSRPHAPATIKRIVYTNVFNQWFVNSEYLSNTYPKFKDSNLLSHQPSKLTCRQLQQAKALGNKRYYVIKAQLGMASLLVEVFCSRNYALEDTPEEITVRLRLSTLSVNETIAVLHSIIENGGKNTAVSHNIGDLELGHGDTLPETLQNLRECISQLSDQEKKELDTTSFIDFAKKHHFFSNTDVMARHPRKAPLLSFFYQTFKDFTFEGIQIGEFVFL